MKVLVDTSVWSLAFRAVPDKEPASVVVLKKQILAGNVVLLGIIVQEVLQAFRSEKEFHAAARALAAFPLLQLDRSHYVEAAALHRICAAKGVTAATIDCQIAAAAIAHRCRLLTTDADFRHVAKVSTLKLA